MEEISIKEKLNILPDHPGVYLMKDRRRGVIYIGKAHSLRDRVRSYFQKGASLSPRIESMVKQVADIEWIVTASDLEALILENNLIKKHKPRYNIILRDDKNYPFLKLKIKDRFPRIEVVRRISDDGALYFGPYVPVGAMRETLKVIKRVFPLATCKLDLNRKYDRPCIEYEIGRCAGPCIGVISEEDYSKIVRNVRLFLEGKDKELLHSMRKQMEMEAERLNFEEAARIRDRIFRIEKVLERQRIVSAELKDIDVIGMARDDGNVDLQVLFFRRGMLVGRKDILYEKVSGIPDGEILLSFIEQFYSRDVLVPEEILLSISIPEMHLVRKWLSERRKKSVRITIPGRGKKLDMLTLALENAKEGIRRHAKRIEEVNRGLEELCKIFRVEKIPERIEAFDISNIFGAEAVGSMVIWERGNFKKDGYRHFRIKTVVGIDDFAMMKEVVERRYKRLLAEGEDLPELIIIDGGKGQLNAAIEALNELGIEDIYIIGLAKGRGEKGERVFVPDSPEAIELDMKSEATHLLQRIRDEAHRFAISYHRRLRGKEALLSELDHIKGIGRARKLALLKYFGSIEVLKKATLDELIKSPGMTRSMAEKLYRELRK